MSKNTYKKIIWESVKIDLEQEKIFYKTVDHYHYNYNVSFKDIKKIDSSSYDHYKIFRELLLKNHPEYFL